MTEELLPCPTCAKPMPRSAIWCENCKLYQQRSGDAASKTKSCMHCGAWVPAEANYCVRCQKGLGPWSRVLSRIQLPLAGISALTALVATLTLWTSNLIEFLNQNTSTQVILGAPNAGRQAVELIVTKTGKKNSYLSDVFLLARAGAVKGAELPACLDERQKPVINFRNCDAKNDTSGICVKIPLKASQDRIGSVVKEEVNYMTVQADVIGAVSDIKLSSKCELPTSARSDEELIKSVLRDRDIASVCDVYYSLRESNDDDFALYQVKGAAIKDCGALLYPPSN